MRIRPAFGLVLLPFAGCQTTVDVAKESQALLATDRAWSASASAGKNADSVVAYWTDDARDEPTLQGKDAIRKMVTASFSNPSFHINWTPERAVVASAGDIGYTVGTTEMTVADAKGATVKIPSRYIATWRKEADGRWRCVEDFASPSPRETSAAK
jgi:ketosteroid isomerase-like protein